jgi:hypothetical protein
MGLIWARIPGRRDGCLRASVKGHVFETSVGHGGGWYAFHYGPRGAVKGALCAWDMERARTVREWCEKRAKTILRNRSPQ